MRFWIKKTFKIGHQDHTDGIQPILSSISQTPIRVSKHRLANNDPEPDKLTEYNYITDMHVFETEGATLRALYTPGHTNDHLCFYLEEENALFSGDCILGETSAEFEDLHDYMRSLQRILDFKPSVIYPGHGPVVKDGVDKIEEYIKHRNKRNGQILEALKKSSRPMDPEDLVKEIYIVWGFDLLLKIFSFMRLRRTIQISVKFECFEM